MENVFMILILVCMVALVVGMIKPNLVIRWGAEEKKDRKSVIAYYLVGLIVCFIGFGVSSDAQEASASEPVQTESSTSQVAETPKVEESKPEVKEEPAKEEVKAEEPIVEEVKEPTVGDTVETKKYKATLNSMEHQGGNLYVFDILLENLSDTDLASSTIMCYEVSGDDGYKGEFDMFADTKGSLDGSVPAKGKLRGQIAFEMQEGSNPEYLSINLDLFSNKPIKFKLN